MREIAMSELDTQAMELVPARETLFFWLSNKWAAVAASNTSLALNVATINSLAYSEANQLIYVSQ